MATVASAICSGNSSGACRRPCGRTIRRRQGLCRLLRQENHDRRSRRPGSCAKRRSLSPSLAPPTYTYAEATWTQKLADWIEAHVRMFRFFGGVPRLVVPDNLKSGVHRASFYDPEINRSYGMMASHYGVGILPARPRKPRDKAKVESRSAFCPDLYPRAASPADLLLAGRGERGNRRRAGAHQRARHAPARRQPPTIVRDRRDACPGAVAGCRLPVRGMAPGPRLARLSRRGRRLLLLSSTRPDPGAGRRSRHHPDHRVVPSGFACCCSPAPLWRPPARH